MLGGYATRKYLNEPVTSPMSNGDRLWGCFFDYDHTRPEMETHHQFEFYDTYPKYYQCSYEDPVRGFGARAWSSTEGGHSANEFLNVVYRVMIENNTGAGWAFLGWDGASTNECELMCKLLLFLSDSRAGNF